MARVFAAAYTWYWRDGRVKRETEALAHAGHEVVCLTCAERETPREAPENITVLEVPARTKKPDSFAQYIVDYLKYFYFLFRHLVVRPREYDLIHINNMPDFLVFAAIAQKLAGVPIILDVHDTMPEMYGDKFDAGKGEFVIWALTWQFKVSAWFADHIIAANDAVKDIIVDLGVPERKVTVLLNLPDERVFKPRAEQPERKPGDGFIAVYHGLLAKRLGLDLLVRAAAELRGEIPGLEVRIIGGGEYGEGLRELRAELGVEDVVSLTDSYVDLETIPGRVADADIGVVPMYVTPYTLTILPSKLLEYTYMAIPCVAVDMPVVRKYFDERMVRFYDPEGDALGNVVEAIRDMYYHPEKRAEMVAKGGNFYEQYRWSEHKQVYVDLVEGLISRN